MNWRRQNKQNAKRGGGVLLIIAALFIASGVLRLGTGTGAAIAREFEAFSDDQAEQEHVEQYCEADADVATLLDALQQRQSRLVEQEEALMGRLQALAVAEAIYEQNTKTLIEAENALAQTMARSETAAEDDISRLITVYETMKAKDAAALFEEMDPDFSAGFLGRMRPDAAAAIMAGLTPQKAYTISVVLAGRNAAAPTE